MQDARLVSDGVPYCAVVSSFVKLGKLERRIRAGLPGNRIVHSSSIKPSIRVCCFERNKRRQANCFLLRLLFLMRISSNCAIDCCSKLSMVKTSAIYIFFKT
ncbi:hypothetical protein NC651_024143 [Populus alba x Populus x berolinensis]|nr:hypothetical protein NC651_024143 [Populus alba x Populus x berolinensis]